MENYENKELLKDAAKKSLESLKDLKPGTEEYNTAANMALKLYDMQLKDEAQENEKQLKEDEAVRKVHELELDQDKAEKARKLDWAKIGMKALTFAGTIGMTVYWSICEAGGVTQLSRAIGEGVHELKRGFTYSWAQIKLPDGTIIEGKVDNWNDCEGDQLRITIDGTTYLVHAANAIMKT